MSKDTPTPARPALDAMAEEIKRLTAIADAFPVRTIEPTDARLRPEWELKSYLRNNAPTIHRLLEAVDGAEKALEKIEGMSVPDPPAAFALSRETYLMRWVAKLRGEARSALATLRAAREGAR